MHNELIYRKLLSLLSENIVPIDINNEDSLSVIIDNIGNSRIVLMGESTHGTYEFYQTRIALTQKLIKEKGFHAIAIEGDWPSAYKIHQYINHINKYSESKRALTGFDKFPQWMWCNTNMVCFIDWLKDYNTNLKKFNNRIGFYGLDLYSLYESIFTIFEFLGKKDSDLLDIALKHYSCFDHACVDPQEYGFLVNERIKKSCIKEVTEQLLQIQQKRFVEISDNSADDDLSYCIAQNARLIKNAERYYRAMFESRDVTWNIRDRHMAQTLSNLIAHIETKTDEPAKVIVWAHNSHIGDARATEMSERGEVNLGQIVREQYDISSYLLGFTTYDGVVRAASKWGGVSKDKQIQAGLSGSYEALFHDLNHESFFLNLRSKSHLIELLKSPMLQRAIGVQYLPDTERWSHYFLSRIAYQFDGVIHIDKTKAVVPIKL